MSFTKILRDAQDPDDSLRDAAEGNLKQLKELDLTNFLLSLSAEIASDESPLECRRLAGIILKDSVEGKYSVDNNLHIKQWFNLDPLVKAQIKESLLFTLGSSAAQARHASSQIIGSLAFIEIPRGEWQGLIDRLLGNMAQQGASPPLKQGTLEALEYVFAEFLGLKQDKIDAVLDAVIRAMNRAEQSSQVRLAAVKALHNVLKHANFAKENCRSLIMSAIRDAAESDEAEMIKQEAFGCLVVIASRFYMILEPYMETILGLTTEALKGGKKSGALQCIEFWITMCEKMIELGEQRKLFRNAIPTADCRFIEKPLYSLVTTLLETLLNQVGDVDGAKINMSAMSCLGIVARTIGDSIVTLAMQFIEDKVKMEDWRSRKAATSVLGVILEGPSVENLAPVVGLLVNMMEDPNMEVRRTAACTLGRVFKLLHSPALGKRIFTNEDLPGIVAVLAKGSKEVPEVSEEVFGAIYYLARGYEPISSEVDYLERNISSELSPFLSGVIDALLSASELPKETPFGLPASSSPYEALIQVVRVSNLEDCKASIAIRVLMPRTMRRLNTTLDAEAISSGEKSNKYNLQAFMCEVLHVIIEKLDNSLYTVSESAQFLLLLFCRVLTSGSSAAHDKAALAIGTLARAIGPKFVDHMLIFLQYYNVKLLSPVYLMVIGNIFHVLGDEILPYCDYMMDVLFKGLSKRTLKPHIFACFGEIALAIGKNFDDYLPAVMKRLKKAAKPSYYDDVLEDDEVDYRNQLRQGIFKAYSGMIRGIKDPKSGLKVAARLVEFAEGVCDDQSRKINVSRTAVDVLGDLHSTVGLWTEELIKKYGE